MRTQFILLLTYLVLVLPSHVRAENLEIRILDNQSSEDTTKAYFEELFILAIKSSLGQDTSVSIVKIPSSEAKQSSLVRILEMDIVDLIWTATTQELETQLRPIRIPLVMGLLGYRIALTHKDNLHKLSDIDNLKSLKACQVRYWTDFNILEYNLFNVVPVDSYRSTFELTHKKRCDYFPRAIFEGYPELLSARKQYPGLVLFDDTILHYPYAFYAFTSKDNQKLHDILYAGLKEMAYSGEQLKLLKRSAITKHLFPLQQWHNKKIIRLANPYLPKKTPLEDEQLWLDIAAQ